MLEATVFDLEKLPVDRPMALITRRRVMGERMMVSAVVLERGFELGAHRHENEQFVVVLRGRAVFGIGEPGTPAWREVEVTSGQVLVLPPSVMHSCRAIEETHILDLFSPPTAETGIDVQGKRGG